MGRWITVKILSVIGKHGDSMHVCVRAACYDLPQPENKRIERKGKRCARSLETEHHTTSSYNYQAASEN
jgi:hypothetical protein